MLDGATSARQRRHAEWQRHNATAAAGTIFTQNLPTTKTTLTMLTLPKAESGELRGGEAASVANVAGFCQAAVWQSAEPSIFLHCLATLEVCLGLPKIAFSPAFANPT